ADPGPDHPHVGTSLAGHLAPLSRPPHLVAGERGVDTTANEQLAPEMGVTRVVIPYAGRASPSRVQQERTAWLRRGFRFRARIEGRLSVWRRRYGLARCLAHGEADLGCWGG